MTKNELLEMEAVYKQLEATERRAADLQAQLDAANFRADNECKLANKWEGENRALQAQLDAANERAERAEAELAQRKKVVAAAGELLAKSVVETESNRWQFSIHAGAWTKLVDALRALNGHGEAG